MVSAGNSRRILAAVMLPPPRTGQALATERHLDLMSEFGDVETIDITHPSQRAGPLSSTGAVSYLVWFVRKVFRIARSSEKDRVFYYCAANSLPGALRDLVMLVAASRCHRRIAHVHNRRVTPPSPMGMCVEWARELLTDRTLFLSPGLAEQNPLRHGQKDICPNPVRDQGSAPNTRRPSATLRLVMASMMIPEKGFTDAVDAVEILLSRGISVHLDLLGAWPTATRRQQFERTLRERGLSENVRIADEVNHDVVLATLSDSDFFLLPSRYRREALPLSIVEAMSAGVPTIATSWAGIPDLLSDGGGVLIDPDVDLGPQIADAVQESAAPTIWSKLSAEARKNYRSNFTYEVVTERWLAIFSDL